MIFRCSLFRQRSEEATLDLEAATADEAREMAKERAREFASWTETHCDLDVSITQQARSD